MKHRVADERRDDCRDPDAGGSLPPMTTNARVGIVGYFNAGNITHQFTNRACADLGIGFEWIPTDAIVGEAAARLDEFEGVWIAPASPYRSMDGALAAIRYARERGVPLVGT